MPSGTAPTAERPPRRGTANRLPPAQRPEPMHRAERPRMGKGVPALLTVLFWGLWVYLILPLASALLWFFGVRLFLNEMGEGSYQALVASLVAYSTVFVVLFGLLVTWIGWNIMCYSGSNDRRTVKKPLLTDDEVRRVFRLEPAVLARLRDERLVRLDLDEQHDTALVPEIRPARPPRAGQPERHR